MTGGAVDEGTRAIERATRMLRTWEPRLVTAEVRRARAHLDAHSATIDDAVARARSVGPRALGRVAVAGLGWWVMTGRAPEARTWCGEALVGAVLGDRERAAVQAAAVRLEGVAGGGRTPGLASETAALARATGLRWAEFEALYGLAGLDGARWPSVDQQRAVQDRLRQLRPASVRERVIEADVDAYLAERTAGLAAEARSRQRALDIMRASGYVVPAAVIGSNLAQVHLELGDPVACGAAAAESALDAREIGDQRLEARSLGLLAIAHAFDGDTHRAGVALRRGIVIARALDLPMAVSQAVAATAIVALVTSRDELAVRLAGTPWSGRGESPSQIVAMSPFVRRRLASAERRLGQRRVEQVRAEASHSDACTALDAAAAFAEVLAAAERPVVLPQAGLTPREVEVVTLLADGLSDREIGSRLVMSAKTVSVHLARVRQKTGLRSRVELALSGSDLLIPSPAVTRAGGLPASARPSP